MFSVKMHWPSLCSLCDKSCKISTLSYGFLSHFRIKASGVPEMLAA